MPDFIGLFTFFS